MPQPVPSLPRRTQWLTGTLLAIVLIAAGTYIIIVQMTAVRQSSVAACLNETFQSSRQQSLPLSWSAAELPLPQLETKLTITTALPSDLRMFSIAAAMCCSEMQRDIERHAGASDFCRRSPGRKRVREQHHDQTAGRRRGAEEIGPGSRSRNSSEDRRSL